MKVRKEGKEGRIDEEKEQGKKEGRNEGEKISNMPTLT